MNDSKDKYSSKFDYLHIFDGTDVLNLEQILDFFS